MNSNNKLSTVIFDLDGTLAITTKRREISLKPNGKIDWSIFHRPENVLLDVPNWPVIRIYQSLRESGYRIGIFSARSEVTRTETEKWLNEHGVYWDFFRMRPNKVFKPDTTLKKEWLDDDISKGNHIMCVFDDRDGVVQMWRENGIACMQVAPGNF